MAKVLFEVTEDHLETGLRGYPVGYCDTSYVDPQKGLFYCGYPVSELASTSPEEAIYLLYHGKKGEKKDVQQFFTQLQKKGELHCDVIRAIRQLPRRAHPMKLFSSALLIAGMLEGKGDYQEDCLHIIAKIPEIAATVINHHAGWPAGKKSNPSIGYMENFVAMLGIPNTNLAELTPILKLFNILHFDHGGGNLSAFVGKAVSSGLEDMYGSLASAMCALSGPRHGKANQDALELVKQVEEQLHGKINGDNVEKIIRKKLEDQELIYGFGHAVLRVEDPRATAFYTLAEKSYSSHPLVQVALLMRERCTKVLKENPKIHSPYPNVDAISGTVLSVGGFPHPQYYTILFGLARVVGIAIQIVYERCFARNGKGTPIYRPKYIYKERENNGK